MKSLRTLNVVALVGLAMVLSACSRQAQMDAYVKTMQSGIKTLPWPNEMEKLFGEGDHFITHYGFDRGPKEWQSVVYFGGRYEFSMVVTVDIDYRHSQITTNRSQPKFYLWEVASASQTPNGGYAVGYSNQWVFDEAKWKRLVAAKGDWSVIGIPVNTNNPIPGFKTYVDVERQPRVKIPH